MFTPEEKEKFNSAVQRASLRTIANIKNTCQYAYDNPVLAAATVAVIGACMVVAIKATIIALMLGAIVLFGINFFKPESTVDVINSSLRPSSPWY